MDKIDASMITTSRSLDSATFLLAGWRFSHQTELSGDLPVPLEYHTLTMNTIELQLSDVVADISMLQCSAQFRILFIHANFVADNASHALASSATAKPTFNVEEEVVITRNGWTPKRKRRYIYMSIVIFHICMSLLESTSKRFFRKPNSKLDLPTFRQGSGERKNAAVK